MKNILPNNKTIRKNSPFTNFGFMQLNLKYCSFIGRLAMAKPSAVRLLMFFMENCDYFNQIQISQKEIAKFLDISVRYVAENVKFLKAVKAIKVIRVDKRTENSYILNPEICWGSYGYNVKKCKFDKNRTVLDPITLRPFLTEIKKSEKEKEITTTKQIKSKKK